MWQMGSIDFIVESSASLSNFTDAMSVFDLPYLFPDAATARKALSGEAAQGQLDALESIGMKGINYWENGIYAIGAVKPVKNLADLKGMRVRSIDSPLQADVYSALALCPWFWLGVISIPPSRSGVAGCSQFHCGYQHVYPDIL